jgi:adenylate cyclase
MMFESTARQIEILILATLVLVCVPAMAWHLARRWRLHRRLRRVFADALPRAARKTILRGAALFKEEGKWQTVTCLSCGLGDMAALARAFGDKPDAFAKALEQALTMLGDAALAEGGTIAAQTAQGVTAVWNAPLRDDAPAIHACAAASAMTNAMPDINAHIAKGRRLSDAALPPLRLEIGLATGEALTGVLHLHGRTLYAAAGEAAARARDLRNLCARYGLTALADAPAHAAAHEQFGFLQADYRALDKEPPAPLYALLGNPLLRGAPKTRALMTFHDHIFAALRARQWDKARALIEQARQISAGNAMLYDLHLARIAYWERNPPGQDWDGAFRPIA